MDRFIKIFFVLATLLYFAEKEFLQVLIYSIIAIEFILMVVKELKKRVPQLKEEQD